MTLDQAALDLALAVSWRSIEGPRAAVRLSDFGPGAYAIAVRLCMQVVDGTAYLGPRTPDLAEALLVEHTNEGRGVHECDAARGSSRPNVANRITGPPAGPPRRGLRRKSTGTFLHVAEEFR